MKTRTSKIRNSFVFNLVVFCYEVFFLNFMGLICSCIEFLLKEKIVEFQAFSLIDFFCVCFFEKKIDS